MASKSLAFVLTGIDQSASSTLGAVGLKGSSTADKVSSAFSKMGSALGGEFGEIGEKIGGVFESLGEEGEGMGKKLAAAGLATAAVGAILTNMGASDKQAEDQLKQAVENTGSAYSDYSEQIEKVIGKEENYAHSAVDTQNALRTLTTSTGDTSKAISDMTVVTNLAAAKHESLSDAATQVSRVLSGTGAKTLAQYGIVMGNTGDKTKDAQNALDELSKKLDGQADASMDNWGAKVDIVKTKLEDWAAKVGEKLGPAITAIGPALILAGSAMDLYQGHVEKAEAAEAALAAQSADTAAATVAGSEETAAAGAASELSMGPIGIALGGVALAAGAATLAYKLFGGGAKEAAKPVEDLTTALEEDGGAFDVNSEAIERNRLNSLGLYQDATKGGASIGDVTDAVEGSSDAMGRLTDIQKSLDAATAMHTVTVGKNSVTVMGGTKAQQDARIAIDALVAGVNKEIGVVGASTTAANDNLAATAQQAYSLDKTSDAYKSATTYAADYNTALNDLDSTVLSAVKSEDSYLDSLDSVTASVKENGRSLDDNTTKGRANREAIENSIGSLNDNAKAQLAAGVSITTVNATLTTNAQKLLDSATKAGLNKTQVAAMIKQMALTPGKITTQIVLNDQKAMDALGSFQDKLNYLGGLMNTDTAAAVKLAVILDQQGGTSAAANRANHASGGVLTNGSTFDEYGLEAAKFPDGTTIIPHGQTQQMMRDASSPAAQHVTVNVYSLVPTADTGKMIVDAINMASAQHGSGALRAPWLAA